MSLDTGPHLDGIDDVARSPEQSETTRIQHQPVAPDRQETEEDALYSELYEVQSWPDVARLLHDRLELTKAEIARGSGVVPETVARWLEDEGEAQIRASRGLDELRYVVLALLRHAGMRRPLLRFWLSAKNIDLGTDPLSAVAAGRFEEVITVGREFARGRRAA